MTDEPTDEDRAAARESWLNAPGFVLHDTEEEYDAFYAGIDAVYLAGLRAGREKQREEDARICENVYGPKMVKVSENSYEYGLQDQTAKRCAERIRQSAEPPKGEPTAKPIEE